MKRRLGRIILAGISSAVMACSSLPPQTRALRTKELAIAQTHQIQAVPFIAQSEAECGPSTLAMVFQFYAVKTSVLEVSKQVMTEGMKGSLQMDMITASRRQGFTAIPIQGFESLLLEVAEDHPVIIFENLGISWLPQWHFALVTGYDRKQEKLIMHSGPNASVNTSFSDFERDWKLGNYWGLVVLPPGELSPSSNEIAHLQAAAGLEATAKLQAAKKSYQAILKRWSQSLAARIGLANVAAASGDWSTADSHLTVAVEEHPEAPAAWFNLAIAQFNLDKPKAARISAQNALDYSTALQKPRLQEYLQPILDIGTHRIK